MQIGHYGLVRKISSAPVHYQWSSIRGNVFEKRQLVPNKRREQAVSTLNPRARGKFIWGWLLQRYTESTSRSLSRLVTRRKFRFPIWTRISQKQKLSWTILHGSVTGSFKLQLSYPSHKTGGSYNLKKTTWAASYWVRRNLLPLIV